MKVVDATWEKRNLDCRVLEITLDSEDSKKKMDYLKDEIQSNISSYAASYIVLKFHSSENTLLQLPALCGFSFIENQLTFHGDLKTNLKKAESVLRQNSLFHVEKKTSPEDFDFIANEIKKGLFTTDRIALDSKFGVDIANKRYANWLLDLKKDPSVLLSIVYMKEKPIGYELAKYEGCDVSAIHGGLLSAYQKMPIGLMEMASLIVAYEPNFKTHIVNVSSNNISVTKGWQFLGYQITAMNNVFVKHIENL